MTENLTLHISELAGALLAVSNATDAQDEFFAYDRLETAARKVVEAYGLDTSSSASRQHYIDTGEYLREGEAL